LLNRVSLGSVNSTPPTRVAPPRAKGLEASPLDQGNSFLDALDNKPMLPKIIKQEPKIDQALTPKILDVKPKVVEVNSSSIPQMTQKIELPPVVDMELAQDQMSGQINGLLSEQVQNHLMTNFLTESTTKLDIKPEQWINAMLKVEPDQLLAPSSETIDKVVSDLDIMAADFPKAKKMYVKLVENIKELDAQARSQDSSVDMLAALGMAQMPPTNLTLPTQAKASFPLFVAPKGNVTHSAVKATPSHDSNVTPLEPEVSDSGEITGARKSTIGADGKIAMDGFESIKETPTQVFESKEFKVPKNPQRTAQVDPQSMALEKTATKTDLNLAAEQILSVESAQPVIEEKLLKGMSKVGGESASSSINSEIEDKSLVKNIFSKNSEQKSMQFGQGKKDSLSFVSEESVEGADAASSKPEFFIDSMRQQHTSGNSKSAISVAGTDLNVFENPAGDANTQEIIRHAQIAVRQGGGEMKFHLNPENLGQVNMRMIVQNGQVQLSFDAESPEAKKIIEGGLGELRSSLAIHNLSLENVKVDVSAKSDNQMNNTKSDGGDANREQAKSFMENFRDDRKSQHNNYIKDSDIRQRAMSETRANRTQGPRGSVYSQRPNKGSLHLVA